MRLTIAQYLELKNAGYTDAEISDYNNDTVSTTAETSEEESVEVTTSEKKAQTQPEQQQPEQQENETQSLLRQILGVVQTRNINDVGHNGAVVQDPAEVLATILGNKEGK